MYRSIGLGMTLLAGVAIGAVAVGGLHAQGKAPGAYAIVDISEITDAELFKTLGPKASASGAPFGAQYTIRTNNITAVDGTAPKRFVVIGFESMDKAKGWNDSALQKEVDSIRRKSTKSRVFFADGAFN
jgi:uncharacterized protein (DUF1330 family)